MHGKPGLFWVQTGGRCFKLWSRIEIHILFVIPSACRAEIPRPDRPRDDNYFPINIVCSAKRLEYPNSLSYQATTFTKSPSTTWVKDKSMIAECGFPTISEDTIGSVVTSKTFSHMGFFEYSINALLTSSTVVFLPKTAVKSESDPTG